MLPVLYFGVDPRPDKAWLQFGIFRFQRVIVRSYTSNAQSFQATNSTRSPVTNSIHVYEYSGLQHAIEPLQ
jgi:hypothetical protein